MSNKSKARNRTERAAEMRAEQGRRERRRRWLTIGAVVGVMALIVGGSVLVSVLTKTEYDAAPAGASTYGFTYGEEGAPDTVVIYEDFLCSHCGALEQAAGEDLTELADQGEVLLDYRPIAILGEDSVRTLSAFKVVLEQSGAEVAKEFHDELFAHQADAPLSDEELVELAVEAGATEDEIRAGIESRAQATWAEEATQAAVEENVTATPTVFLDDEPFSDGSSAAEIGENLVESVRE